MSDVSRDMNRCVENISVTQSGFEGSTPPPHPGSKLAHRTHLAGSNIVIIKLVSCHDCYANISFFFLLLFVISVDRNRNKICGNE